MTTLRQIKTLCAPLLERHSDLVLVGWTLLVKPIRHVARAVAIDRTGSADLFRPQTASTHLFSGTSYFPLGTGHWIYRGEPGSGRLWLWSDPSMPDDFVRLVEQDALPTLRSIKTLEDYVRYSEEIHAEQFPYFWGLQVVFGLALGQLDRVRDVMNDPRWTDASVSLLNNNVPGLGDRLRAKGAGISLKDRKAIAGMLHGWEARSVEKLKLTKIWERTPFPLEEQF